MTTLEAIQIGIPRWLLLPLPRGERPAAWGGTGEPGT